MNSALSLLQRRPHYRRFWLANLTSQLGDWLTYVAVSVLALETGTGAIAVAMVLLAHQLPQALLSPYAGAIADRFDRKKVMLFSATSQAILTAAMAVAAVFGALLMVQLLLTLRMAMVAFFDTAENASVPRLVDRDELELANSFSAGTWSVMFALGVALGGVLVAMVGPIAAIAIDAGTFMLSAFLLAGLPPIPPEHDRHSAGKARGLAGELLDAWRFAEARPAILTALFAKSPVAFAGGAAWIYLVESSTHWALLGAGAITLGALHAVRGIGTGVGPVIALMMESKKQNTGLILGASALAVAAGIFLLSLSNGPGLALLAVLIWGMGSGANWVKSTSVLQKLSPDGFRGRLAAIDLLTSALAMCGGAFCGAALMDAGMSRSMSPWLGILLGAAGYALLHGLSLRSNRLERLRNSIA